MKIMGIFRYDTISFTALLSGKSFSDLKVSMKHFDEFIFTSQVLKTGLQYAREVSSVAAHIEEALKEKKLLIHCFSMNGLFTLTSLQLQYPQINLLSNCEGIIFDRLVGL